MKRYLILFLLFLILSGCKADITDRLSDTNKNETTSVEKNINSITNELPIADTIKLPCSKDSVSEFMSVLNKIEIEINFYDELKQENCYNVTPDSVSETTDIKIFKFSDSCASFVFIDNEIFPICNSFGGYGFVNAVPWDYDEDGNIDLLVASSWGSGIHRSEISVFNTKTKESILIYNNCFSYIKPSADLFVGMQTPSFIQENSEDLPVYYLVYSAHMNFNGNSLVALSYTATDVVGSVTVENGVPVFVSSTANIPSFSYDEVLEYYKDNPDPGLKLSGFKNTEKIITTNIDHVIELAKKECTVEYDSIKVGFDSSTEIYCVSFYKENYLGGNQDIYIAADGITQFIVYGE